jgi:hypothetical protein|eukprot:1345332-Prymnesium_polylepis.1
MVSGIARSIDVVDGVQRRSDGDAVVAATVGGVLTCIDWVRWGGVSGLRLRARCVVWVLGWCKLKT